MYVGGFVDIYISFKIFKYLKRYMVYTWILLIDHISGDLLGFIDF